jgi:hypothetical protein
VLNNGPPRLEYTKCTLHILLACLLFFRKPPIFLLRSFTDGLDKSGPLGKDAISMIVSLVVMMAINLIVNHYTIALYKPTKDRRSLEHVDVIMGTGHAKKRECQIHRSCDATTSRMKVHPSACPLYCPCHANRHLFHFQCMQSIFLIILRKPLASMIDKIRAVSPTMGSLRLMLPNTEITALQKVYIVSRQVGLAHSQVLINKIIGNSICKHANSCKYL